MKSSMRKSCFRAYSKDGEALAAQVLLRGRDPQIGGGFHSLSMKYRFSYCIGQIRNMECVMFHATELLGQDGRLFLTEPCRPQIPTSLAPV